MTAFTRTFDILKYREHRMNTIRTYIRQVLSEADDADVRLERQVGDTLTVLPGVYMGTDPDTVAFYNSTAGFLSANLGAISGDVNAAYETSPPVGVLRTREDDAQLAAALAMLLRADATSSAEYPYRTALYMIGAARGMVSPSDVVTQIVLDTGVLVRRSAELGDAWGFTLRGSTAASMPEGTTPDSIGLTADDAAGVAGGAVLALVALKLGPALKYVAQTVAEKLALRAGVRAAGAAAGSSAGQGLVDAAVRAIVKDDAQWREIIMYLARKGVLPSGVVAGARAIFDQFLTGIDGPRFGRAMTAITNVLTPEGAQPLIAPRGAPAPAEVQAAILEMIRAQLDQGATGLTRESFEAAAESGFRLLAIGPAGKQILNDLVGSSARRYAQESADTAVSKAVRDALWDCLDVFKQAALDRRFSGVLLRGGKIALTGAALVSVGSVVLAASVVGAATQAASLTDALVDEEQLLPADAARRLVTDVRLRTAAIEAHAELSDGATQLPMGRVMMGDPLVNLGALLSAGYTSPASDTEMRILADQFDAAVQGSGRN